MRVEVDLDKCTGHGICESIAEDVFEVQDDGIVLIRDGERAGDRPRSDAAGRHTVSRRGAAADRLTGWNQRWGIGRTNTDCWIAPTAPLSSNSVPMVVPMPSGP